MFIKVGVKSRGNYDEARYMNTDTITFVTVLADPDGNVSGLEIEHGAGRKFTTGVRETIDLVMRLLPRENLRVDAVKASPTEPVSQDESRQNPHPYGSLDWFATGGRNYNGK